MMNESHNISPDKEKSANLRKFYSFHFDWIRIVLAAFVILVTVVGIFLIGLYIGSYDNLFFRDYTQGLGSSKFVEKNRNSLDKEVELQNFNKGYSLLNNSKNPIYDKGLKFNSEKFYKRSINGENNIIRDRSNILPLDSKSLLFSSKSKDSYPRKPGKSIKSKKQNSLKHKKISKVRTKKNWQRSKILPVLHKVKTEKFNGEKKYTTSSEKFISLNFRNRISEKFPIKKGYQIQVASFRKISQARKIKKKLVDLGINGGISAKFGKKGVNYRVSFGAGKPLKELENRLAKVRFYKSFRKAFIIKM